MDYINQLLSLNIEIEGLLRVLESRHNELAQQLLLKKSEDFLALVRDGFDADSSSLNSPACVSPTPSAMSPTLPIAEGEDDSNEPSTPGFLISEVDNSEDSNSADQPEQMQETAALEDSENDLSTDVFVNIDSHDSTSGEFITENYDTDKAAPETSTAPVLSEPSSDNDSQTEIVRIDEMLSRREASDLSKAFTLNDRFRFQRAVFGGSRDAFNAYISSLSSLSSYDEALAHLSRITSIDEEDPEVIDFLTILQNHYNA